MLIFQGFANSRIVREFPPFSFKVRIATLTRNRGSHSCFTGSNVLVSCLSPIVTGQQLQTPANNDNGKGKLSYGMLNFLTKILYVLQ